jgi:hypothetical protein
VHQDCWAAGEDLRDDRAGRRGGPAEQRGAARAGGCDHLQRGLGRALDGQDHDGDLGVEQRPRRDRDGLLHLGGAGAEQHRGRDVLHRPSPRLTAGDLLVQPSVRDGHPGDGREPLHELLVLGGELLGPELLGEVDVAVHLVPHEDRCSQERPHGRVAGWEPVRRGVAGEVAQPQRDRFADEQAEDAVALRQVSDAVRRVGVDPLVHELDEGLLVDLRADDAERPVARAGEFARRCDDALQRRREVEVGSDREQGIEQPLSPPRARQVSHAISHVAGVRSLR